MNCSIRRSKLRKKIQLNVAKYGTGPGGAQPLARRTLPKPHGTKLAIRAPWQMTNGLNKKPRNPFGICAAFFDVLLYRKFVQLQKLKSQKKSF